MQKGTTVSWWGDARSGKLPINLLGFGRALRRAGVAVDAERMALAQQSLMLVGVKKADVAAALSTPEFVRVQDPRRVTVSAGSCGRVSRSVPVLLARLSVGSSQARSRRVSSGSPRLSWRKRS